MNYKEHRALLAALGLLLLLLFLAAQVPVAQSRPKGTQSARAVDPKGGGVPDEGDVLAKRAANGAGASRVVEVRVAVPGGHHGGRRGASVFFGGGAREGRRAKGERERRASHLHRMVAMSCRTAVESFTVWQMAHRTRLAPLGNSSIVLHPPQMRWDSGDAAPAPAPGGGVEGFSVVLVTAEQSTQRTLEEPAG